MPESFFHYTTKVGHEAILASKKLLPSVLDGVEHTHYGKGIYFGTLDPHFDAHFYGIKEVGEALFNQVSNANLTKFFYYVEVIFPDGSALMPKLVTNNSYLYLLETLEPLELSIEDVQPGRFQVISHGLTYWGQLHEMKLAETKQELLEVRRALDPKPETPNNKPADPNWKYSIWNINSKI